MPARSRSTDQQLAYAVTAARAEVHRLLDLFPILQAEFTTTNHTDPAGLTRKGETATARAHRIQYQKEYRERQKLKRQKTDRSGGVSASARKKLSQAMKARWKKAKEAGTTLVANGAFTATTEKKGSTVIDAAAAIERQLKKETKRERKNRLQREWRAARKGVK